MPATAAEPNHVGDDVPAYDPYLMAYHRAFRRELAAAVTKYDLPPGAKVLDVPCGDGFYSDMLASHLDAGQELTACDLSPAYLERAKEAVRVRPGGPAVRFVEGDAYALPFDAGSFDLVWCAQSFISLDRPVDALREFGRVLAPGGTLAVLETDEFHHVLLPWPVGLELSLGEAIRTECERRYGSGSKYAQARKLRAGMLDAGLTPTRKVTLAADRQAPFDPAAREFLARHFTHLREIARADLTVRDAQAFDRFTDPDDEDGFLNRDDAELTCLTVVAHATK